MVNYRRVVCEAVLFTAAVSVVAAAPACDDKDHKLVYDQRQNGSENYRLSIDGVVIAVAPAESFMSVLSEIDLSDLIDLDTLSEDGLKPPPPASVTPVEFHEEKPVLNAKPEKPESPDQPLEKPEKPQESQDKPEAPSKIDDVSVEPAAVVKGHKKSAAQKRQENTNRLKQRIASIFLPFLRKRRHQ